MEDEKKKNDDPDLGDWSPDYFPTSPVSVFKKTILLFFFLGGLAFWVAQCSEDPNPSTDKKPKSPADDRVLDTSNPFSDEEIDLDMPVN